MNESGNPESAGALQLASRGWRAVRVSSAATFAAALAGAAVAVSESSPAMRLLALTTTGGIALIRAAIMYSAWTSPRLSAAARWTAWIGGFLAAITVIGMPVVLMSSVDTPAGTIAPTPWSVGLALVQLAANAGFLVGLGILAAARRRGT